MNKVYVDSGYGITVESLKFWNENKKHIGQVKSIVADRDVLFRKYCKDDLVLDYSVRITGVDGMIYLSGCNCGYGGEGPNGTRKILEELGLLYESAVLLMHMRYFECSFDPKVFPLLPIEDIEYYAS